MTNEYRFAGDHTYAELHLHLGGASTPEMLWQQNKNEIKNLSLTNSDGSALTFHNYAEFRSFFNKQRSCLDDYLGMHKVVMAVQCVSNLDFYIQHLIKRLYEDEHISYLELRHCPYGRTNPELSEKERMRQMESVVAGIHDSVMTHLPSGNHESIPMQVKQVIYLNSQLSERINFAILEQAIRFYDAGLVCGIDIASGEKAYVPTEIQGYFRKAKENGLPATAHIFETPQCDPAMLELIPYLDRIGHGIFLPLMYRKQFEALAVKQICLEVCPTTYLKCGLFTGYNDSRLRLFFNTCEDMGVDIAIGTDNGGIHQVSLPEEFRRLLANKVIDKKQAERYRRNAFRHTFTAPA